VSKIIFIHKNTYTASAMTVAAMMTVTKAPPRIFSAPDVALWQWQWQCVAVCDSVWQGVAVGDSEWQWVTVNSKSLAVCGSAAAWQRGSIGRSVSVSVY
jgi:hypothetical protein